MVRMSRTAGMRSSVTGSAVSRQAASAGKAEFFAPLTAISPCSGLPPRIRSLSIGPHAESCRNAVPRILQKLFRFAARQATPRHHDGRADAVAGGGQHTGRLFARYAGRAGDNPLRTVAQLRVLRLHVYHQVAIHIAETDHDRGGN